MSEQLPNNFSFSGGVRWFSLSLGFSPSGLRPPLETEVGWELLHSWVGRGRQAGFSGGLVGQVGWPHSQHHPPRYLLALICWQVPNLFGVQQGLAKD